MTVADWRRLTGRPPNLDVAVEADVGEFLDRLVERVGGWRRPARRSTLRRRRSEPRAAEQVDARRSTRRRLRWRPAGYVRSSGSSRSSSSLIIGINVTGTLDATADPNTGLIAARTRSSSSSASPSLVGFIAYAVVEYAQTKRFESITSQFDTRTIVLIPIAIAINIILGQTVAAALKVPIYLDSIGTILVGVLAGPIAGALTGGLANLIWTYVLPAPFHSDYAAPFFIVAVEIGLLAGVFGRLGFFRSRPNTPTERLADRRRRRRR